MVSNIEKYVKVIPREGVAGGGDTLRVCDSKSSSSLSSRPVTTSQTIHESRGVHKRQHQHYYDPNCAVHRTMPKATQPLSSL